MHSAHVQLAVTLYQAPRYGDDTHPQVFLKGTNICSEKRNILTGLYVTQVRRLKKHTGWELLNRTVPGLQTAFSLYA